MEKFSILEGVAAPFPLINVDTDMIIPKQFLKSPRRTGYAPALFHELRFNPDGTERPDFILNQPGYREASVLIAGDNFGCGSSREHAPWAVVQYGIRCIVAPSFADIFENNCFKNAILPIRLERGLVERISRLVSRPELAWVRVDLPAQLLTLATGEQIGFEVDAYRKHQLIEGLDAIGVTRTHEEEIAQFEINHWLDKPWLHPLVIRQNTQKETQS